MRKFFYCILTCLLFVSCQNHKNQIVIDGVLQNAHHEWVRLSLVGADNQTVIDSVRVKDGEFHFTIPSETIESLAKTKSPMMYQLSVAYDNSMTTAAQPGEHLNISADARNLAGTYRVNGGTEAVLLGQLDSALSVFSVANQKLYKVYQEQIENDSVRADIEQKYVEMVGQHRRFLENFIRQHPNNLASYIAFYQSYNRRNFFSEIEDYTLLKQITNALNKQYPDNPYLEKMQLRLEVIELQEQQRKEYNDTH